MLNPAYCTHLVPVSTCAARIRIGVAASAAAYEGGFPETPSTADSFVDVSSAEASARHLLNQESRKVSTESALRTTIFSQLSSLSPNQVTLIGAFVNIILAILKLVVGRISGSAALMSDAYHSWSDLLVDGVCLMGLRAPRAERACTLAIAGLLASAGAAMMVSAAISLQEIFSFSAAAAAAPQALGAWPLLVALVSIASKEGLFRVTRRVSLRARSSVLLASAQHHRQDAMSSMAAAVGTCGVLMGLPAADTLAAGVVGGMMVAMGWEAASGGDKHDE